MTMAKMTRLFRSVGTGTVLSHRRCMSATHEAVGSAAAVHSDKALREGPRNDWSKDEIKAVYDSPMLDLLFHGVSACCDLDMLSGTFFYSYFFGRDHMKFQVF